MKTDPIKVYDCRWEVPDLDDAEVRRLWEAVCLYARELDADTMTITRDARLGAGRVMAIGLEAALAAGFRVFLGPDPVSTPQSYFVSLHVAREHPRTFGAQITASHNPASYIGLKLTTPVGHAIGRDCGARGGLTRISEHYHGSARPERRSGGTLEVVDFTREYVEYAMQQAGVADGDLAGLRVVIDPMNGSAGPAMHRALRRAGVEVHALRLVPDGHFPTGSPNPTSQGKMDAAVELCGLRDAHAAIGIDGDGDRLVFADRRGVLTAGFAFVPILKACLDATGSASPQPPVLYDPKVNPLALAEWGRLGTRPVLFRNGHSQIKDYMDHLGALAAAEESGHYYHRLTVGPNTVATENSVLTVLLFLKAVKADATLLDRLHALESQIFTTGEFNYQFSSDGVRDKALDLLVSHFRGKGAVVSTTTSDGIDLQGTVLHKGVQLDPADVRLEPGQFSGYVRVATNEKGVVRSYFSTGDADQGRRLEAEARRLLEEEFAGKVVEQGRPFAPPQEESW